MQLTKQQAKTKTSKEVIATAQDIKYARFLAGNDKTIRDRAVKSLRKWFEQRCRSQIPFTDSDLMLIWKGLFYSMWMSDKALIQEECAERISALIHSLDTSTGFLFFKAGMKTLANEWFGIDQWRHDKFLMFVRRLLRQTFILLKKNNWELKLIKLFASTLEESILNTQKLPPLSLFMHFCDIYMPELAKISEGQLNANILNEFLHPFVKSLATCNDTRIINAIADNVFRYLMKQSDVGLEFDEKYAAWQRLGFPGGSIDAMQRADEDLDEKVDEFDGEDEELEEDLEELEEDAEEKNAMDPRAGRVDVVLPQIHFSGKNINSLLTAHKFKASNTKARSAIKKLVQEFSDLSGGDYPLGVKKVELYEDDGSTKVKKSANKLVKFENQLYGRNKDTKKRKSTVEDEDIPSNKKLKLGSPSKPEKKTTLLNGKKSDKKERKVKTKSKVVEKEEGEDAEEELKELRKTLKAQRNLAKEKEVLSKRNAKLRSKVRKLETDVKETIQSLGDDCFIRNSGTWFVTEPESDIDSEYEPETPKKSPKKILTNGTSPKKASPSSKSSLSPKSSPSKSSLSPKSSPSLKKETKSPPKPEMVKVSPVKVKLLPTIPDTSTPLNPTTQKALRISLTPSSTPKDKLFKTGDWDAELQDGEMELFVPSKKYLAKRKSVGATSDLVEKSLAIVKAKNRRRSADTGVLSRLNLTGTPRNKKVKIDLRMNQSQEVYEHHAQIRSSPGIPFDANRMPAKPVIKANAMASPINPFYSRRRVGLQF